MSGTLLAILLLVVSDITKHQQIIFKKTVVIKSIIIYKQPMEAFSGVSRSVTTSKFNLYKGDKNAWLTERSSFSRYAWPASSISSSSSSNSPTNHNQHQTWQKAHISAFTYYLVITCWCNLFTVVVKLQVLASFNLSDLPSANSPAACSKTLTLTVSDLVLNNNALPSQWPSTSQ